MSHDVFSSQFQNLETLQISDDFPIQRNKDRVFTLDDSHLRAEGLRHLTLESYSVDWNSKLLQSLTQLKLTYVPDGYKLGCHDFLLVLSKMPTLETLELGGFLDEEKDFESTKVHLQHLRELYVQCAVPEMAQFLPCLVVPRSCELDICTGNEYDEICDKFRAILSWVSDHLRVPTTSSNPGEHEKYIRSFHIRHDADNVDFTVKGFFDVLSHKQMLKAVPNLKFVVLWTYEDDNFSFNLQTFLSLLPLGGLAFLDMVTDFNVYLSPELWTVAFGSIQTLKEMYLNTDTSNFWEAFTLLDGDHSLPFSALTSITVDDDLVESQLILDKIRVRSELGGTRLQNLSFSSDDYVIPQLMELVSQVRTVVL